MNEPHTYPSARELGVLMREIRHHLANRRVPTPGPRAALAPELAVFGAPWITLYELIGFGWRR